MENIIEVYRQSLNLNGAVFSRIDHSDAMVAEVYRVDLPNEAPLILKVCRGDDDFYREVYFLKTLAGSLTAPKLLKIAAPKEHYKGALLMEYIEGHLLEEEDWSNHLAYEVGEELALLHSNRSSYYGDPTHPIQHVQNYFSEKFFEELKECSSHLHKTIIKQCKNYFADNQKLLETVDGPCLVHRDFRPGNMIVHKGRLTGIIDWASGRFGFAEQDFCDMVHKNWPKNPEYKKSLLAGYSNIRQLPNYKAIMSLLRLGKALAVIGFTVKTSTWIGKNQEIYQYNRQYLDTFLTGLRTKI